MDPSGLTLEQVQAKLKLEDPARYRQAMRDLKYTGEEPNWIKKDFLDKFMGTSAKDPALGEHEGTRQDITRIERERNVLSMTLEKQ